MAIVKTKHEAREWVARITSELYGTLIDLDMLNEVMDLTILSKRINDKIDKSETLTE
jgi:hypothetical protein